jgi:chromosome segregation ATPase
MEESLNKKHFNYIKLLHILSESQENFKKIVESLIKMSNQESQILKDESVNYIEKKFSDIFDKMEKENKPNEDNLLKTALRGRLDVLKQEIQELNNSKSKYEEYNKNNEINDLEKSVKELEENIALKKKTFESLKSEEKLYDEKISMIEKERVEINKKYSRAQLYIYKKFPNKVEEVFQNNTNI